MYINFDKCRKEIIRFEDKRNSNSINTRHPKESKPEALALLKCHSKKYFTFPNKVSFCLTFFNI